MKKNSWMRRAKNKRKAGFIIKGFIWLNLLLAFLLAMAYMTPFVPVESWGWLSLLALAYPFLLLVHGLFIGGWIIFRPVLALISVVVLLAGWNYHTRYFKLFTGGKADTACAESIVCTSYNLRGLSMVEVKDGGFAAKIDAVYDALSDAQVIPDILCLQEAQRGEIFAEKFGLTHHLHAPKSTLWLITRFPILKHGTIDGEETSPSAMWADLQTPQGILRVYNVHLVSNRVTTTAEELKQDLDLQNESTWSNVGFIFKRYRQTTALRALEASALNQHIHNSPYPALVAGDVNDTPLSRTYHVLRKGLQDGFREAGSGWSTTYESTLPLLRIDYFLGTPSIQFKEYETHDLKLSDHFPVSTSVCVTDPTES